MASDITSSEATITWQPPANDGGSKITGYIVERQTDNSNRWIRQTKAPVAELVYKADNLMEGSEYTYRVIAVNQRGESAPSEPSQSFTAKKPYGKCQVNSKNISYTNLVPWSFNDSIL